MDKLEHLLLEQAKLSKEYSKKREWYEKTGTNEKLVKFMDAIIDECSEMKQGLNWKPWKNKKPLDHDYLKEELIDILHFWLDAALHLGMNEHEIVELYNIKSYENKQRQIDGGKEGRADYISHLPPPPSPPSGPTNIIITEGDLDRAKKRLGGE